MLVAYNALLSVFAGAGRVEEALTVYRRMRECGPQPDAITMNTLITGCAASGDVARAMRCYHDMLQTGTLLHAVHRHAIRFPCRMVICTS